MSYLNAYNKLTLPVKFIVLTTYIALVNSYALFIVYPTIKANEFVADLTSLGVYLLLTVPLVMYIITKFRPRPQTKIIGVGILLMIIITVIEYSMSHISLPILLLHIVFYLFAGMIEETLWRGKLWQLVGEKVKKSALILVIVTAHFVVLHIPFAILEKQSAIAFLGQVLALGILLGVLRIVTKKVTVPACAHAIINMAVYT